MSSRSMESLRTSSQTTDHSYLLRCGRLSVKLWVLWPVYPLDTNLRPMARWSGLIRTSGPLSSVSQDVILPPGVPTYPGQSTLTTGMSPIMASLSFQPPPCPGRGSLCSLCADKLTLVSQSMESRTGRSEPHSSPESAPGRQPPNSSPYQPGQRVWLSSRDLPLQVESSKLASRFIGPFEIEKNYQPICSQTQAPRLS